MSYSLLPNTSEQLRQLRPQVRLQEEKQTRKQHGKLLELPLDAQVIRDGLSLQMRSPLRLFEAPDVKLVMNTRTCDGEDESGIPLRVYAPHVRAGASIPVLFYIHGGGFVAGNLDDFDLFCRTVCVATECCVVSVEYRLAPEHPYPAAAEDCYRAAMWVQEPLFYNMLLSNDVHLAEGLHCIGGESAGANLALSVCLRSRAEARNGSPHPEYRCMLLGCPMADSRCDSTSYTTCGNFYSACTSDVMRWCWTQYAPRKDVQADFFCSPSRCEDWTDLPPSIVHVAEFDPLCEEGRSLHEFLTATTGVEHCWYVHPELDAATPTLDEMSIFLRSQCGLGKVQDLWQPKGWAAAKTAFYI